MRVIFCMSLNLVRMLEMFVNDIFFINAAHIIQLPR